VQENRNGTEEAAPYERRTLFTGRLSGLSADRAPSTEVPLRWVVGVSASGARLSNIEEHGEVVTDAPAEHKEMP
jgi:hypothetical protein